MFMGTIEDPRITRNNTKSVFGLCGPSLFFRLCSVNRIGVSDSIKIPASAWLHQSGDCFLRNSTLFDRPSAEDTGGSDKLDTLPFANGRACGVRAASVVRVVMQKYPPARLQFSLRVRVMLQPASVHRNQRPGYLPATNKVDKISNSHPG